LKDPLTGVNNRASFENTLRRETDLAHRHGTSLSMILMDIDNFQDINDRFGHLIGDCVLREVAQCAAGCVRSSDMVFRYGGEEFAIILSNTEIHGAELLAERIRRTVQRLCCNYGETSITVTASMGVATLVENDVDQGLLQRADRALYQAKGNGRNRVAVLEHTS
jgi:diguanylate cyclase (GGDEF)-like protein